MDPTGQWGDAEGARRWLGERGKRLTSCHTRKRARPGFCGDSEHEEKETDTYSDFVTEQQDEQWVGEEEGAVASQSKSFGIT